MLKVVLCFSVNVEFISTIGELGVQKLTRIYIYGKFKVWMITV